MSEQKIQKVELLSRENPQLKPGDSLQRLDLCDFFESYQGEFPDIGYIYTFVRFRRCNFSCPWCHFEDGSHEYEYFDVRSGGYARTTAFDNIRMFSDTIRTFDPDQNTLQNTQVLSYQQVQFNLYYEITLQNGTQSKSFKVSPDHHFAKIIDIDARTYEWTDAASLNVGDQIIGENWIPWTVTNIQIQNTPITLTALKTSQQTYLYGGILHHNCDTDEIMKTGSVSVSTEDLVESLRRTKGILFTGGEPSMYIAYIRAILDFLKQYAPNVILYRVAVETNGTNLRKLVNALDEYRTYYSERLRYDVKGVYVWSPKFYDTMSTKLAYLTASDDIVEHPCVYVKLVYEPDKEEILHDFIDYLVHRYGPRIKYKIGVMPEGATKEKILDKERIERVVRFCKKHNINVSTRLHIIYEVL